MKTLRQLFLSLLPTRTSMKPLAPILLILAVAGCAASSSAASAPSASAPSASAPSASAPSASAPSATDSDRIVIRRDSAGAGWLATWQLVQPVRELRFERPAGGFRGNVFEILTPGFRMDREDGTDVLRTDRSPVRQVSVRFPEFDERLVRDYEFFRVFTDGGVAIYTGHLVARPVGGTGERPYIRRFRFEPPPGTAIVAYGERHTGPTDLMTGDRGTYVYMGSAAPVTSEDMIAIIDPGLPAWIVEQTERALPRLFALYRERLDAEPSTRPLVLFDYKQGDHPGTSFGGGTLPGLIQLGVEGTSWREPSQAGLLQLMHFLAHEAAHVWNGEIVHYPGNVDAWMHEGSADALADRALLDMGLIDERAYRDRQTEALNACRTDLAVTTLRESLRRGRPRAAYTCGNTIALLTEAALRLHGADLFDFWRTLIARSRIRGGEYDAEAYIETWRALGADSGDVAMLRTFLDGTAHPSALVEALVDRGVAVDEGEPSAGYALGYAREAMMRIMASDCGGRVGFRPDDDGGFLMDDDIACGSLVPGARVLAVGGHAVVAQGSAAYDAVQSGCGSGAVVVVLLELPVDEVRRDVERRNAVRRDVEIRCEASLPPRPAYVRILEH